MTESMDVQAVVTELRAEVERRRQAGEYDERAMAALHEEFGGDHNDAPEAVAYVASSRPLASDRAVVGPMTVFTKRVVRRLLAWYVAPIAEDQTRFNVAAIRLIRGLEQRVALIEQALGVNSTPAPDGADASFPALTDLSASLDRLQERVDEVTERSSGAGAD